MENIDDIKIFQVSCLDGFGDMSADGVSGSPSVASGRAALSDQVVNSTLRLPHPNPVGGRPV